jgi:hypothetical protein
MATIGRADVTCRPLAVSNTSPAAGTPDIFFVRLVEWEKKKILFGLYRYSFVQNRQRRPKGKHTIAQKTPKHEKCDLMQPFCE